VADSICACGDVESWHVHPGGACQARRPGGFCECERFRLAASLVPVAAPLAHDAVNHPRHYTSHPSGIECIDVVEHMPFNLGNAVKYVWRAGSKGDAIEDLEKAKWYITREIERRAKVAK
jgi:hypothetical protein